MTIDKQKLKALAEEAKVEYMDWVDAGKPWPVWNSILVDLQQKLTPEAVLALLAEIKRLDRESQNLSNQLGQCDRERRAFRVERDQLKAENEALRKDAERYRAIRDDIPHVELGRAILDVQSADEYDAAVDAAMAKEASHG